MNKSVLIDPTKQDGVDYCTYPPPRPLFKAMNCQYAKALINNGQIRLGHTDYYRQLANENVQEFPQTGGQSDKQEGTAILINNGNSITVEGILHTYIFCLSTSDADHSYLLGLDPSYDTIVRINDPHAFALRLLAATKRLQSNYALEAGKVIYNKGNATLPAMGDETELSYYYNFQKGEDFKAQHEFRFAVTDLGHRCLFKDFMHLNLGSCKGLVENLLSK